jgi:hypothetical protein
MAKRVDIYYSERSAFYILKAAQLKNDQWFYAGLQPSYVADCYGAHAYYVEGNRIVGLRFSGEVHKEFTFKKSIGYAVPKRGSDAEKYFKEISANFNVFGIPGLHQFSINFIDNYENVMKERDEAERAKRIAENTKTRTVEVFRCDKGSANKSYGLYRSPFCVGFYVPDVERAQQDLLNAYGKNCSAAHITPVDLSDIAIRIPAPLFPLLMALDSPYHLQPDNTVLEFPEHVYTTRESFLEHIVDKVVGSGVLPQPIESDLPELTLWLPEVV